MGFQPDFNISILTVFAQGLLSFFSPCVLPLIPLYLGYLTGGYTDEGENFTPKERVRTLINTLFFVIGIGFAFFVLALGMTAVGSFFGTRKYLLARIGGVIVILFGLYQLGLFGTSKTLNKEKRIHLPLEKMAMSPVTALLMGFVFSFAWTPCVGPTLTSVLLMAASSSSKAAGFLLIGVYTLGFVIPFIAVGIFADGLLRLFRKHRGVVRYTAKIGGALLVVMGILMLTGTMNKVTGVLAGNQAQPAAAENEVQETGAGAEDSEVQVQPAAAESEIEEKEAAAEAEDSETPAQSAAEEDEKSDSSPVIEDVEENASESDTEQNASESDLEQNASESDVEHNTSENAADEQVFPAPDFTLMDQYGEIHSLSDYKGKAVFLNFWATWCPPCRSEMPDIQKIYEKYKDSGDVAVIAVAFPGYGNEQDEAGVKAFLEENGYTYPVMMDTEAELLMQYGITAYPTTFMIDKEGNIFGYVPGAIPEEFMESIIQQTLSGVRES